MFLESFKVTLSAVGQIFLLAAIGYFLVKKSILGPDGLSALSRLVMEVALPIFIFVRLTKGFNFSLYPDWWIFPILSIAIIFAGLALGYLFSGFIRGSEHKLQFLSLVGFQNSGYLPMAMAVALFPKEKADMLLIYIFLFLLGFNLLIWSLGVYLLTFSRAKKFELGSLFSPPVIAVIFSLIFVLFGLNKFVPEAVIKPLGLAGECTLPLAMFVVGGNLAQIRPKRIDKKAIFLVILAKLLILPLLGLWLVTMFRLPELMGLLVVIQLAVPPATSLSVITHYYKKEDLLISQGVFFGHIVSLITIPLFLSLYFTRIMIK